MDFWKLFSEDDRLMVADLKQNLEWRLRPYRDALMWFFGELFSARLSADWRDRWHAVVAEQNSQGRLTDPNSVRDVEEYLEAWARFCGLEPVEQQVAEKTYTITFAHRAEEDAVPLPKPPLLKPLSPLWPRLTQKERDHAQALTGLPSWYPLRPENRMDSMWQLRLERLARTARDELLTCYTEIASFGRLVNAIHNGQDPEPSQLDAQLLRVQQTYDKYLLARIAVELEWANYLRIESLVGPEVLALIERIDAALPTRIDGFKSPVDVAMAAALKAVQQATEAARARGERQYTIAVWTDRAVTLLQLVAAGVTVGKAAAKIFVEVAEQSGKKAAAKAAAKYVAVQLVTATASMEISAVAIPKVLAAAGLDPMEVQIGMAAYGAIGVLSIAAAGPTARRIALGRKPRKIRRAPTATQKPERVVFIEGTPDSPRTREHKFLQLAVAEDMSTYGDYVRVGMGMSLKKLSGHNVSTDIKPDNIGLTVDGKIDMIEIRSPRQSIERLEEKLTKAMSELPAALRGQWTIIDPDRKLPGN